MEDARAAGRGTPQAVLEGWGELVIYAPCELGRPHRDGRRVLCFADWSRDYGVPAWFNRNGYVQDISFCRNQCLKRPDIVEVKLEGSERCSVPAAPARG